MRELVITDTAKEDIESIALFLENSFSNRTKTEFLLHLSEHFALIESMPFMYQASETNPLVRRCVIHKNAACFYKVTDELIFDFGSC
jgi:plasmid stabilization system protein ParE